MHVNPWNLASRRPLGVALFLLLLGTFGVPAPARGQGKPRIPDAGLPATGAAAQRKPAIRVNRPIGLGNPVMVPRGAEIPEPTGPAGGFTIAQLKYGGGGDWYEDESGIQNLLLGLKARTSLNVAKTERVVVSATEEELFNHPFLYLTGHGNIKFSPVEVERLRAYLEGGGFLWVNDDYGLDGAFRREIRRVLPADSLVELPFDHDLYHSFYKFDRGLPKIHEHDGKPPQGLGIYHGGRLVVFYDYETDIGDGLEDEHIHNDSPAKREEAMKMAINIVMYALTH